MSKVDNVSVRIEEGSGVTITCERGGEVVGVLELSDWQWEKLLDESGVMELIETGDPGDEDEDEDGEEATYVDITVRN